MIEELILTIIFGLVIPVVFAKLVKADSDTYTIIFVAFFGCGFATFSMGNGFVGGAFTFIALLISLIAFIIPSWSVKKIFYKSIVGILIFAVFGAIAARFNADPGYLL